DGVIDFTVRERQLLPAIHAPSDGETALAERVPVVSESNSISFDRIRSMMMRAAEIRDSEQQQVFDSLDEIHARLGALDAVGAVRKRLTELPDRAEFNMLVERLDEAAEKIDAQDVALDALGTIRKRLSELPDRSEVGALAERLDQAIMKIEAQDALLALLSRALDSVVDKVVDKLAIPLTGFDNRLDGVAGRFEGVAGRLDGLDERLSGLHKRRDELDNRLDRHEMRLDGIPSAVSGALRDRLDGLDTGLSGRLAEVDQGFHHDLDRTRDGLRAALVDNASEIRAGMEGRLDILAKQQAAVASRLDQVGDMLLKLIRQANEESQRRNAGQLDEAMAAVAEMIIGRSTAVAPASRASQRRGSGGKLQPNGRNTEQPVDEDGPPLPPPRIAPPTAAGRGGDRVAKADLPRRQPAANGHDGDD
ncbi:MAG: hypothetical protein LC799_06085, partial [Actinobacteria bacterium]|nr:hypothetical protein [Actinomycetota bacterium]